MKSVHPVFYVSQLELALENPFPSRQQPPPPPVEINGEPEYEISEILDSKIDWRHASPLLYLVKWMGYEGTDEETSWIPSSELPHAQELISNYHVKNPAKPGSQST